jgi:Ca2+-binding EF-hand superfamily protein
MKRLLFLSTALTFIAMPCLADEEIPANIQRKYDRRLEEMKLLDKNKDGVLQAEELQGNVQKKFDATDTNKNGAISAEEREAAIGSFKNKGQEAYGNTTDKKAKRLENRYNNADANKDGQVSKQEYDAYFGGRYQNFDRDGDGVITKKEYRSDTEKMPRSYKRED